MDRVLVIGRFQPFHKGHLASVEAVADDFDEVVIVVGSAEESHTMHDPFTAGERVEMIRAALSEAGLDDAYPVPVRDLHRNALWVHHVETYVPSFDAVVTHNPLPARLFSEAGYEVVQPDLAERKRYQGEVVRQRLLDGGDWAGLVPDAVAEVVERVRGERRMREVEGGTGGRDRPR